jgi:hypothetical protein
MMLACPELRVVPATIHIPLAEVPARSRASCSRRRSASRHAALDPRLRRRAPRIAVAGLNPHAGEGGLMGREEIDTIAPVLEALRAEGIDLAGPLRPTRCSTRAARARYDAAVAMYHDQALIPIKTIDFAGGVNVTLGLPFVRTSPDHGTAFDIAGRGQGRPDLPDRRAAARRRRWRGGGGPVREARGARGLSAPSGLDGAADVGAIDDLPPLRAVIAAHGLSARKALGQNFLLDLNLTAKIARRRGTSPAATCSRSGRARRAHARASGRGRAARRGGRARRALPARAGRDRGGLSRAARGGGGRRARGSTRPRCCARR